MTRVLPPFRASLPLLVSSILPPPGSVRRRLLVWNVGVLACVLLALGAVFRYRLQADSLAATDRHLSAVAHEIARHTPPEEAVPPHFRHAADADTVPPPPTREGGGLDPPLPAGGPFPGEPGEHAHGPHADQAKRGQDAPPPDRQPEQPGSLRRYRPRLLDTQGHSLFPDDTDPPWSVPAYRQALQGREVAATATAAGEPVRVYSLPLRRNGSIYGVVQTAASLAPLREAVAQMTRTLLALIPLALLATAVGGAFLTTRALRPVREITQAAAHMEASSLGGRLPVAGTDEFSHLAATFNAMLARLEGAFVQLDSALQQQKRFAADASHELRTPLTIIKANTSLALSSPRTPDQYRQALSAADLAADRMTRLVRDLLLLARSDAGQEPVPLVPLPLAAILAQAAAPLRLLDTAPPVALDAIPDTLRILGDTDSLVRLFGNLLENAARHTPPRGSITITAASAREPNNCTASACKPGTVTVFITDTGEGIPSEHLPRVTERFYRADAARARAGGGTGLGLAICLSIVAAHGGTLALQSTVGVGTTVLVTLPAAPL